MMIVHPDFLDHWKTLLLVQTTGDKASPLVMIRLWAHCQQRKQWAFPRMTPEILKAVCHWEGEADALVKALTACGFIETDGDGITVHGWAEANASLIANWKNGAQGGRPRGTRRKPTGSSGGTEERRQEKNGQDEPPISTGDLPDVDGPTLEMVLNHADRIGLPPEEAERFYHHFTALGWINSKGIRIRKWQSRLVTWKNDYLDRKGRSKALQTPVEADYRNPNDALLGKGKPA